MVIRLPLVAHSRPLFRPIKAVLRSDEKTANITASKIIFFLNAGSDRYRTLWLPAHLDAIAPELVTYVYSPDLPTTAERAGAEPRIDFLRRRASLLGSARMFLR